MTAPVAHPINGHKLPDLQAIFAERCEARAILVFNGQLSLHEAVDELQHAAESSGLIDRIGQDATQNIMGEAFALIDWVWVPDDDDLDEAYEREIMLRVRQWELDDPRDRWRHTSEAPPNGIPENPLGTRSYRTPESTVTAFWFLVGECQPERLKAWLANHPRDRAHLLKLLEGK